MSIKKQSKTVLTKELDRVFSIYIRQRGADINSFNECFTCGAFMLWSKLQCGHFQSRRHMSTRWDECNCQPQCVACNMFRQGEQFKFGKNLDSKYGEGTAELLEILSKKTLKLSPIEIKERIEYYTNINKEL